jgi:hypothetical protein
MQLEHPEATVTATASFPRTAFSTSISSAAVVLAARLLNLHRK